jgi:hypothetical protein
MGADVAPAIVTGSFTVGVGLLALGYNIFTHWRDRAERLADRFRDERLSAAQDFLAAISNADPLYKDLAPDSTGHPKTDVAHMNSIDMAIQRIFLLFPEPIADKAREIALSWVDSLKAPGDQAAITESRTRVVKLAEEFRKMVADLLKISAARRDPKPVSRWWRRTPAE